MSDVVADELEWCETTAEFLATQNDFVTATELRAFHALPVVPPAVEYHPELVYGTGGGRDLRLLLYARADASLRRPAILVCHGGGWRQGTKVAQRRQAAEFAALGFVAGSIEYRFSTEAPWPAALEDVKCAVRYLRAHHASFGVDPDRVVIAGGSAGAHLAALTTLAPDWNEGSGGNHEASSVVQAGVLFSPPVDLRPTGSPPLIQPIIEEFLGGSLALAEEASPITHVHKSAPPILTLSGDRDPATRIEEIRIFHQKLDTCGVPNELVEYPGRMHGFGIHGPDFFDVIQRTASFIEQHLGALDR